MTEMVRRLRDDPGVVVLEGFHALKHALRFGAQVELALTSDPEQADALAASLAPDLTNDLRGLLQPVGEETLALAAGTVPRTGIVSFARRPAVDLPAILDGAAPLVLLEDPRHLGNVGAVIRVAAAAEAGGVLTTGTADPWDPAAIRGAAGLHFALPVCRVAAPPATSRPLIAVDPEGESLEQAQLPPNAVLAFGTERHGLSDQLLERADARVRIPMRAGVSSLNLATAVAVVLFSLRLK